MTDDNVRSLEAKRAAHEAAAAARARATTTRATQVRDRTLLSVLKVLGDIVPMLEAGAVTQAMSTVKDLAWLVERHIRPADCTTQLHAGPVIRHPSGVYLCTVCGTAFQP